MNHIENTEQALGEETESFESVHTSQREPKVQPADGHGDAEEMEQTIDGQSDTPPYDPEVESTVSGQQVVRDVFYRNLAELQDFADRRNYDVILYNAEISKNWYITMKNEIFQKYTDPINNPEGSIEKTTEKIQKHNRNVLLILITIGGDAHFAYKSARFLQKLYNGNLHVYTPSYCKSAGTLICLGAKLLFMSGFSELGPIDVQIPRPNSKLKSTMPIIGTEIMSGAEVPNASSFAAKMAGDFFHDFVRSAGVSCADLVGHESVVDAAKGVTIGVFSELFRQMDPEFIGFTHRLMSITQDYGTRLAAIGQNVRPGAIEKLIYYYPDHGSVIDEHEARSRLFYDVPEPGEILRKISYILNTFGIGQEDGSEQRQKQVVEVLATPRQTVDPS